MELWDLYTASRAPTGLTHIRGQKIPDGLYHLVVHVWIRNRQGQYVISQRAASRPAFPMMWETVGGSVLAGEHSLAGALREVKEEVGIDLLPQQDKLLFSRIRTDIPGKPADHILDVWRFDYDGPIPLNQATTGEVAQTKWMSPAQIQALDDAGELVHTLRYFFTEVL